MTNDELTATGRPKGRLVRTPEARRILNVGDTTLRALLKSSFGPPGFKRPGSSHWLFWSGELMDFLESNRHGPTA
jgi:hypothetical protein